MPRESRQTRPRGRHRAAIPTPAYVVGLRGRPARTAATREPSPAVRSRPSQLALLKPSLEYAHGLVVVLAHKVPGFNLALFPDQVVQVPVLARRFGRAGGQLQVRPPVSLTEIPQAIDHAHQHGVPSGGVDAGVEGPVARQKSLEVS